MTRADFEIMAPVGSSESLAAALQAGADSVYFGVGRLNMRAHSASAFTLDDLREIAATCREHGVKSYLTVNTIVYDDDMPLLCQTLEAAAQAGISAVIASDVAALNRARELGLEVHLSTQLNISNTEALRFYAQWADVVVLARELRIEQVEAIHRDIREQHICGPSGREVRIEMFCHGALCMAVSGKCYLSLLNAGRSANRGECAQLCRRAYTVHDADTGTELLVDGPYIMSPKDLKTIGFLDRLVAAGVRVFKIEGRARGPEYVRTVVECYREALDAILADATAMSPQPSSADTRLSAFQSRQEEWTERLSRVFNRGFWDGYYQGQKLGEWTRSYGSEATERKVYVGRATKYYSRLGLGEFHIEAAELHVGDRYLVTGPTTGAISGTVTEMHDDSCLAVPQVRQGDNVSFAVEAKVRPSDKLFRLDTSGSVEQQANPITDKH